MSLGERQSLGHHFVLRRYAQLPEAGSLAGMGRLPQSCRKVAPIPRERGHRRPAQYRLIPEWAEGHPQGSATTALIQN